MRNMDSTVLLNMGWVVVVVVLGGTCVFVCVGEREREKGISLTSRWMGGNSNWFVWYFSDLRRSLCYPDVQNGRCLNPLPMMVSKSTCCCSLMIHGFTYAWGQACEVCPAMTDPAFPTLCPHGKGTDHDGKGAYWGIDWRETPSYHGTVTRFF